MKTDKFQNKYRIPSARAVWHDYNGGDYFITISTAKKMHYFGEINNGKMLLNGLGQKFDELILNIKNHNPYCEIPVYQIMPNQVHLIVCVDGGDVACGDVACRDVACRDVACRVSTVVRGINTKQDAACHVDTDYKRTVKNEKMQDIAEECGLLSTAMGGLKSALTKYANLNKIKFGWQTRFHDHIIRSQDEMNMIVTYIENNVKAWENDKFYTK